MRKPWYRKDRKTWYVTIDGAQVPVGKTRTEAFHEWHRILEEQKKSREAGPTVAIVICQFIKFSERQIRNGELREATLDGYSLYLHLFAELHGKTPVSEIAPHHITDWMASNPKWGVSSQRNAITAIKRVMNWAFEERRIATNPIASVKKPSQVRREQLVDEPLHRRIVLHAGSQKGAGRIDRQFRLALIAIRHCGGRPQDVSRARVEYVSRDGTRWAIPDHKTKRYTSKPRVVYLSPCLMTITRMLSEGRTEGPLMRGRRGMLTVNAMKCRMSRIREQLGLSEQVVCYSYRHTYVTDAMERNVPVATVAKLVGTSVEMIERHYGHLSERHDYLSDAAARAICPIKPAGG